MSKLQKEMFRIGRQKPCNTLIIGFSAILNVFVMVWFTLLFELCYK